MAQATYLPTIGMEIHAELKTATKMFCRSKNDANETRPNVNVCPVCLAHPGTLPVINREAVRHVLRVGIALGARLADYTEFDRKNYFYPDLPKGYQLSQYEYPLVAGGTLAGVEITRVHLEEDTASSVHASAALATGEDAGATLVDYNRAGVPLMELVTEPVITSAEQASRFARELQLLLRYLGVSDANMEKGEMRVEANVSVRRAVSGEQERSPLGTKVEIKNLNSFRAMERAVEYEIKRQTRLLERGEAVVQETRGWDEAKQQTFAQRTKEGSADYRYFPDPDLPSLKLSELQGFTDGALRTTMPELPWERRARYEAFGIKAEDAALYVRDPALGAFFEEVIGDMAPDAIVLASNYIANDLVNILDTHVRSSYTSRDSEKRDTETRHEIPISARDFKEIIGMLTRRELSSRGAKDLLLLCIDEGGDAQALAKKHALIQNLDTSSYEPIVDEVIAAHASVADDFRAGKAAALEYLLGQCMKATRGAADPVALRELLRKKVASH